MRKTTRVLTAAALAMSAACGAKAPAANEPMADGAVTAGAGARPDSIVVAGVTLRGTLELPPARCTAPWPVALIIAGSGPTDRDGNSLAIRGDNDSLRMLAEGLAAECVASLRYDKRGVAASLTPDMREDELRFTTYSDDAAAWLRHLRGDARFSRVVVVGHSEGATLGTLAAAGGEADGIVLIAGAGRPIGDVLREQLRAQAPPDLYAQADSILNELAAGRTVADPPGPLYGLFRPSVQPYLISWLPIDPAAELAALDIPALVVWGTTDVQASRADAERLAAADDDVRLVIVEGMNHVLKMVSGTLAEQMPSYGDPSLPLAPEVVPALVDFIEGL